MTGQAADGTPEVQYTAPVNARKTSVIISATVISDGVACKVTSIAPNAFKNNKKIKSVTIGTKAFYKCTALKTITIPSKVTKIGKQTFYGCKNLKKITIKTTKLSKKTVGSKAFAGIYKKATIKVPKSRQKTYKSMLRARGVGSKAKISR